MMRSMTTLLKPPPKIPALGFVASAGVLALVLSWAGWPLYPLRAWLVGFHEFFHAVGAWVTLGSVESILTAADHGLTMTRGGFYPVVSAAGYLGSALMGAACLRWCASARMRGVFVGLCTALAVALLWKGRLFEGGWAGMGMALAVDALAVAGTRTRFYPFILALSGCLFLTMGFDDLRTLLIDATSRTDAGLLAGWLGAPFLAWPIALLYAAGMCAAWAWSARGLWRDSRAR